MFIKIGEFTSIEGIETTASAIPLVDPQVLENFRKTASDLKKIAPKADDFLYFSAIMMHAAEASALHEDGTPRLTPAGKPVEVSWDTRNGTWKWQTNDRNIKPLKNSNGDIFPEAELVKAYKKWVGKPLCIDHKSSSVDHVRGFIVDTYYDRKLKRVIALCALDKANYPDLARKVATGYSNNVSMGTAVGRAICTDCATVAKTEADFCDHMRRKSSWGEINVDLTPIELSIVVTGADPNAKIKHIVASAQTLSNYIERKEEELKKLASKTFTANFSFGETDGSGSANISVSSQDIESFKEDINKAVEELTSLSSDVEKEEEGLQGHVSEEISSASDAEENVIEQQKAEASLQEVHALMTALEDKLSYMKKTLQKLATKQSQEENMSGKDLSKKGYYQGTEEPTPGTPQYAKDPLGEKYRTEDKHMVGQMDTGPVDGMHPGPDSVGMSELERKKMLARADIEERALRRAAIVSLAKDKLAYHQNDPSGKENDGTPTPGKVKYPADKGNEQARLEDKHMVGQKPFPGVGDVDGLHPSPASADVADEKKRKEMLSRASIAAKFVKASNSNGTLDRSKSAWQVRVGDKVILTASVSDIAPGREEIMFDTIATADFGTSLLKKVKADGVEKVAAMFKKAQVAPSPVPAEQPAPEALPAAPEAELAPAAEPTEPTEEAVDSGKDGDVAQKALDLVSQNVDITSDLQEAVRELTGEKAEMGEMESDPTSPLGANASFSTSVLNGMRKDLNTELTSAMKSAIAKLKRQEEELRTVASLYSGKISKSNAELVRNLSSDVMLEAKAELANAYDLLTGFSRYARGTMAMIKRAESELELSNMLGDDTMTHDVQDKDEELLSLLSETDRDLAKLDEDVENHSFEDEGSLEDFSADDADLLEDELDADGSVIVKTPEQAAQVSKSNPEAHVAIASFDSKAGRAAMRRKLAAQTLKFSPVLDEAHPKGGCTPDLDVKPSGDLAKVEDLEEKHKRMLEVAEAPVKVRKEAAVIQRLISEGQLKADDLDALVAEGLDKDAVSYWKKFYGQADGGSEFASELVKEHAKAAAEEEIATYKVKLARAYSLANEMVSRGLVDADPHSVTAQVEEIMKFNDDSFESMKRVIAQHPLQKSASRIPQVGLRGSNDHFVSEVNNDNLYAQLSAAFSKSGNKGF